MKIALALSGGGHRAGAYHLGVLKYLASIQKLEAVEALSTVSGGSIIVAEIMTSTATVSKGRPEWPSSEVFMEHVLKQSRERIVEDNLELDFIKKMISPSNWLKLGHRANLMGQSLKKLWSISHSIADLPNKPAWIINGTTNISGCRWEVRSGNGNASMGSEDLGYADAANFRIADAAAISAAYPGAIGPFKLDMDHFSFTAAEVGSEDLIGTVHLSDGGIYDNLGLEPLFDPRTEQLREALGADYLVVSDAGSGIKRKKLPAFWRPIKRILRLVDIITQQVRSLRLRTLFPYLKRHPEKGVYIPIGMSFQSICEELEQQGDCIPEVFEKYEFLSQSDVIKAKNTATTLGSLSEADTDRLIQHGFESAWIQFTLVQQGKAKKA